MKVLALSHIFVFALALLLGVWVGHEWAEQVPRLHIEQVFAKGGGGGLTNPLLECGLETDELTIGERAKIEKSVTAYVEETKRQGLIEDASIYFRDLNNGPWFGIDERNDFLPGSLLKLPIAMSLYYWNEREHGILERTIDLTKPVENRVAVSDNTDSSLALVPPGVYTVRDLVGIMLRDSNNDAANVLAEFEGTARREKIFYDLGIEPPRDGHSYKTNVKTYGAFFRVLYNASYLGELASEDILTTLTQATFRDGLFAGVPSTVTVAHKYGTRLTNDQRAPRQLHDCGIVYVPETPYVLCIMTQGTSMKNLERFIAEVSKRVYEGVTR